MDGVCAKTQNHTSIPIQIAQRQENEMTKEELLALTMIVCESCGWEIMRSAISFDPICDDCAMYSQIQHNYEQGITV